MKSEFRKMYDEVNGYTLEEAISKKRKIDEAHEVGSSRSQWKPAEIVPDPYRKSGFMVVIETK